MDIDDMTPALHASLAREKGEYLVLGAQDVSVVRAGPDGVALLLDFGDHVVIAYPAIVADAEYLKRKMLDAESGDHKDRVREAMRGYNERRKK